MSTVNDNAPAPAVRALVSRYDQVGGTSASASEPRVPAWFVSVATTRAAAI